MRIFLVGYMGCGKSRWGKRIAAHYKYQFFDLDNLIEEREGLSIPEIFERYEEAGFREREFRALESVKDTDHVVISTGGGAPCFGENMKTMNELGETLYIEGSPELLCDRILHSKTERPLVKRFSPTELLDYIKEHLHQREEFYLQAKHKIVTGNLELDDFILLLDPIIKTANP